MDSLLYLAFIGFLVTISLVYFKLARAYKIVDLPNHRTMHEGATIRGGGVVVLIAMILFSMVVFNPGYYFLTGLILIGITGFLDDLIDLSSKVRFPIQILSVILILLQLDLFDLPIFWLIIILIIGAGILNAFNFMDGINGITGGYSLVFVGTIIYINSKIQPFIPEGFLYGYMLALLVFSFFNFRKKAVCFAGDVGSLSIAFINLFLLLQLMDKTGSLIFILLFTLYGMDTVFTIIQRISRRENIFEAHKLHLFQVIVSNTRVSHLGMTSIYMIIQLLINTIVVIAFSLSILEQVLITLSTLIVLTVLYVLLKFKLMYKLT